MLIVFGIILGFRCGRVVSPANITNEAVPCEILPSASIHPKTRKRPLNFVSTAQ